MKKPKRPDRVPAVEAKSLVARLSYQDLQRILKGLLWDVFGEVDEDGNNWLRPNRGVKGVDVLSLIESLRQEFWPIDEEIDDGREEE